ncbi:hypothetical protein F7725_026770 [Dissostichus mawsoni]|uniref:Metalloendopeptidase n=1 Tax=Dissostichus mawsoni TaxID=36200 RepID=A0A7J5X811_DISMA|nr:hypothetical protein F7725_026770 [Dissostichus mawsoni]
MSQTSSFKESLHSSSTASRPTLKMTPSASLLLLLLLGLSQAFLSRRKESKKKKKKEVDEEDTVDITTRILTSNNATDEILLEGDLLAPKTRNAMKCWSQSCLWKKGSGGLVTIPFTTSSQFTRSERQKITNAMNAFHRKTCLRFVPRRNQYDYISIENKGGCYSSLGKTGGRQVLSINRRGCVYHGTIQHEINHALGFQHEQTRSDRDSYVRINWQNINPQMAYNFKRHATNNLNTPYDYTSIMHYGRTAFSIQRGKDSITPIPNPNVQIGQRKGMSRWDIVRINKLYQVCSGLAYTPTHNPPADTPVEESKRPWTELSQTSSFKESLRSSSTASRPTLKMTPSASLLLLLLLGLSQALPLQEEGIEEEEEEEEVDEEDTVDITTRILTSNNATDEILLEGDLLAPKTRNAMKCWSQSCLWKKGSRGLVTIPFTTSSQFTRSERRKITNAMNAFHRKTCLRFVPRRNQYDYISIENKGGCYSSLGKTGGRQVLSLNRRGCVYHGTIQHEINHALGFQHEQTRSDRDSYVRINWQNINPQNAYNFKRHATNNLNTPYDYTSIMHYGRTAFSIQRGKDSITPIPNPNVQIGQRKGMSRWDISNIKLQGVSPQQLHSLQTDPEDDSLCQPAAAAPARPLSGTSSPGGRNRRRRRKEEEVDEEDTVDITTRILTSNNATDEILLEGDLLAPKTRNAMKCWSQSCLWKKGSRGLVTIPFTTSSQFTRSERQKITNAMNAFHRKTCLRFVPRRNQYDYISMRTRADVTPLGQNRGRQVLSLNRRGCVYHGTIQHEINHALGFQHEQTRSDRDSYVRINWQNINPQNAYNFKRHAPTT